MDYDKRIEKLKQKKQKNIEKQKNLQTELDKLSDNEILYFKGLHAGKEIALKNFAVFLQIFGCLILGISIALTAPIIAAIMSGVGVSSLVIAATGYIVSNYERSKWQKYQTESINRDIKKETEEYQRTKELEKTNQTENLVSKTTKFVESNENELIK